MAQTGDPDGNGTGGSGKNLKAGSQITNISMELLEWQDP